MRQLLFGRPISSIFAGTAGFRGGALPTPITGQARVVDSGTPVTLVASSTPVTSGVYLVSNEGAARKFYIGRTDEKPTYDGTKTPKSAGVKVISGVPMFYELDDLFDIWIDCSHDNTVMTFLAF